MTRLNRRRCRSLRRHGKFEPARHRGHHSLGLIEHAAVVGLTVREASLLGLSVAAETVATIITKGVVNQPDFEVTLRWQRPTGQAIVSARGTGAWLTIGISGGFRIRYLA